MPIQHGLPLNAKLKIIAITFNTSPKAPFPNHFKISNSFWILDCPFGLAGKNK
jgi:hypothetical protein